MMSKYNKEFYCSRRCKSKIHGQELTSAITKREVSDKDLASFIKHRCCNFPQVFDYEGRTALHMSTSRGRNVLSDWLIRHSVEAFTNARDLESGYTPLHRSIFYGQLHTAVGLIKSGVNTEIVDKDGYRPLDHSMLDKHYMYKFTGTLPTEVYVWGTNTNYTLGTGTQQMRKSPELLTHFNRSNATVRQVSLSKFHSVWVSECESSSTVWVCGQLSRAGAASATAVTPAAVALQEPCLQVAATLNSTLLLMQSGAVLQYSLNNTEVAASQSTTKTPSVIKLPSIKPLMKLSSPKGICGGRDHAVVWNSRAVYSWGVNVGQLGHDGDTDKLVDTPKRMSISQSIKEDTSIELVAASDAATVVTTSRGDVYLLHKHMCKKIAVKQINLRQVCVDAKVNENSNFSRVTVLLLTNVGQLLLWEDTTNRVTRCVFGVNHQVSVVHMSLTHDAVYFVTDLGEAYVGYISRRTPTTTGKVAPTPPKRAADKDTRPSLVKFLEKDDCTPVRIVRIPNVHRATEICADGEGINFACLQVKPTCGLRTRPSLSPSSMSKHMSTLLETATVDDLLHDVVFQIGKKQFPAHIYIIANQSELLYNLYLQHKDQIPSNSTDKPHIILDNVLPEVFDRILTFMYTGSCDVVKVGPCGLKIKKEDLGVKKDKEVEEEEIENPSAISAHAVYKSKKRGLKKQETPLRINTHIYCDPVKLVQAAAKRLRVTVLHKLLDNFYYSSGSIVQKEHSRFTDSVSPNWSRSVLPELVDTAVKDQHGALISAHRCILAARLDYFHGMFMHSWTESKQLSTVSLPINQGILVPVINFLYTDTCPEIETSESIDFIISLLIVADQLFINRLREMCEIALANLITLKNCAELCQISHTYNASQLKQCCMEFICLNITSLLESRSLDHIENQLLEDITNYYCKFNPIMGSRVITPFFNAPSDEMIHEAAVNYPIDISITDESIIKDEIETKKKSKKRIEYTDSEKARMRYESTSLSQDLSNEGDITLSLSSISKEEKSTKDKQEKWIAVPTAQQKQQKVVQARLKAISSAKDILNETHSDNFTTLTKINSSPTIDNHETSPSPHTSRLSSSPKDSFLSDKSSASITINIGPKLSQKQRKKLAMQGETSSPKSLDEFLNEKLSINSPPDKAKNPWKVIETPPVASSSCKSKSVGFNQILADQKKQRGDSSRIMTKPLNLTQLEDKAIEELERFYNIDEIDDELISIRRIELQVYTPQWIHTAPK